MRIVVSTPLLCLLLLSATGGPVRASVESDVRSLKGPADQGVFLLLQREERLGRIEHDWRADGSYRGTMTMSVAGQTLRVETELDTDEDGSLLRFSQEAPTGRVVLEMLDGTLRRTVTRGGKDTRLDIELKPGTVVFENYSPVLWSHAVRCYDEQAGGRQEFPLLLLPQGLVEGWLERTGTETRTVAGRDLELVRYTYGVPGVDVHLWCLDGQLVLAEVPAQAATMVRTGYETLRQQAEDDPLLSKAEFEVIVESDTMVPMRDGVRLATDIYRPDAPGRHPVILIRTPYQKTMQELEGRYYARRGYVAAIQDCRGRFSSEGEWEPFVNEAEDGYDAVEWVAARPWSSGKVGMIGASYLGWVQWWAASQRPPHLVTIIPNVAPPGPFYNIPYEYGVFFLWGSIWWADVVESEATADLSGAAMQKIGDKKYGELLRHLPVIELDEKVLGRRNPYWRRWIEHNHLDAYWESSSFLDKLEAVRLPVFHQSGWFDGDGIGSKLNYARMRSHGHPQQKLILGPWGHTDQAARMIGDRDFGEAAIVDLDRAYLRWFDHFLKGVDNGIEREPLVSLFVMGANRWLHGPSYPLPQTRFEQWHLASGGSANTSKGDGLLVRGRPGCTAAEDRYTYDPGDPTPNPGFPADDDDEGEARSDAVRTAAEKKAEAEAHYTRVTDERADILVYTSPVLDAPLTICGPVSARLYASSSARDTDWFVRLVEVGADGKVFPLVEGRLRARFRESVRAPRLLTPGEVVAYDLDLWQTGIEIPAGSRLRVEVASASFPLFSRNLNTGGHNEMETDFVTAEQVIHHSEAYPSHVLLPVIPAADADDGD